MKLTGKHIEDLKKIIEQYGEDKALKDTMGELCKLIDDYFHDATNTRKKCEKCEYELGNFPTPSIHHGKNYCSWVCKKCNHIISMFGEIAEDNIPYIIPIH